MSSQLKIGIVLNYINLALSGLIPFFYTPIMLSILGQEEYGLYRLSGSLTSYLSLVSIGLGAAITRYLIKAREENGIEEARAYMEELRNIVRYIGVCDGNLEEGSMRCDANISVRPIGQKEFGTRAEIKNVNSFKALQRAIEYEIDRQIDIVEAGEEVVQETRLWDDNQGVTKSMRGKEDAHDYRYFPEPDLMPLEISEEMRGDFYKALTAAENVCFIGDSLTEGTKNGGVPYFEPLEQLIRGKIFNISQGGATTKILLERLQFRRFA